MAKRRGATKAEFDRCSKTCRRVLQKLCGVKIELDIALEEPKKMGQFYGYAQRLDPGRYVIRLSKCMERDMMLAIMTHEAAHVLHWEQGNQGAAWDHGAAWGEAYAKCYRLFYNVR